MRREATRHDAQAERRHRLEAEDRVVGERDVGAEQAGHEVVVELDVDADLVVRLACRPAATTPASRRPADSVLNDLRAGLVRVLDAVRRAGREAGARCPGSPASSPCRSRAPWARRSAASDTRGVHGLDDGRRVAGLRRHGRADAAAGAGGVGGDRRVVVRGRELDDAEASARTRSGSDERELDGDGAALAAVGADAGAQSGDAAPHTSGDRRPERRRSSWISVVFMVRGLSTSDRSRLFLTIGEMRIRRRRTRSRHASRRRRGVGDAARRPSTSPRRSTVRSTRRRRRGARARWSSRPIDVRGHTSSPDTRAAASAPGSCDPSWVRSPILVMAGVTCSRRISPVPEAQDHPPHPQGRPTEMTNLTQLFNYLQARIETSRARCGCGRVRPARRPHRRRDRRHRPDPRRPDPGGVPDGERQPEAVVANDSAVGRTATGVVRPTARVRVRRTQPRILGSRRSLDGA